MCERFSELKAAFSGTAIFRHLQNPTVLLCLGLILPLVMPNTLAVTITVFRAFQNLGTDAALISQGFTLHRVLALLSRKGSHSTTHQKLAGLSSVARSLERQELQLRAPVSHLSIHPPESLQI